MTILNNTQLSTAGGNTLDSTDISATSSEAELRFMHGSTSSRTEKAQSCLGKFHYFSKSRSSAADIGAGLLAHEILTIMDTSSMASDEPSWTEEGSGILAHEILTIMDERSAASELLSLTISEDFNKDTGYTSALLPKIKDLLSGSSSVTMSSNNFSRDTPICAKPCRYRKPTIVRHMSAPLRQNSSKNQTNAPEVLVEYEEIMEVTTYMESIDELLKLHTDDERQPTPVCGCKKHTRTRT